MIRFLIILILVLILGWVGERDLRDAEITERHVAQASERKAFPPCNGISIRQWAAGERWAPKGEDVQAECAPAARRLPNHILTMPVE